MTALFSEGQFRYFASIRPVFCRLNESRPHGIVSNIDPLLVRRLSGSDHMIKEPFCQCGAGKVGFLKVLEIVFLRDFIHTDSEMLSGPKAANRWMWSGIIT